MLSVYNMYFSYLRMLFYSLSDLHVCVECEPHVLKLLWNPNDPSFRENIQKVLFSS